jgi:hypothetical protein
MRRGRGFDDAVGDVGLDAVAPPRWMKCDGDASATEW